jgi:hypothetical protein
MNFGGNFHYWREADDIVTPKNCFNFAQVLLGKIRTGVHGTIIDPTNFERKRIGLRGDEEIRSQGAKFMGETIANVERDAEGRGDDGHAKSESRAGKQLAAGAASKRIGNEAEEHKWKRMRS